jgi:hypothetical protein
MDNILNRARVLNKGALTTRDGLDVKIKDTYIGEGLIVQRWRSLLLKVGLVLSVARNEALAEDLMIAMGQTVPASVQAAPAVRYEGPKHQQAIRTKGKSTQVEDEFVGPALKLVTAGHFLPDNCPHVIEGVYEPREDMLRRESGGGHYWWKCTGCGSRWERMNPTQWAVWQRQIARGADPKIVGTNSPAKRADTAQSIPFKAPPQMTAKSPLKAVNKSTPPRRNFPPADDEDMTPVPASMGRVQGSPASPSTASDFTLIPMQSCISENPDPF